MTCLRIYVTLFNHKKSYYLRLGRTEDKANRLANIYAVKTTVAVWRELNG